MGEGTMCSTPGRYGSKSCGGADGRWPCATGRAFDVATGVS